MNTTYFIGGIATDIQMYQYMLEHIPNSVYLPFPKHDPKDTMHDYVAKFLPLIDTSKPFNIVGTSMGGMMAVSLLKYITPQKLILISSVKSREEMPFWMRLLGPVKAYHLLRGDMIKNAIHWGVNFRKDINKPPYKAIALSMVDHNDSDFLNWCVKAIAHWADNTVDFKHELIHVHGAKDALFPIDLIANPIIIPQGTHHMVLTQKILLTDLLLKYLK
jgi:pimeloyl-ACP methyl ester carboxylesterase